MKAYADASGIIGFAKHGEPIPEEMLCFASGPKKKLLDAIKGCARLSKNNETWLVPGIPEAADQTEGIEILIEFEKAIKERLSK